MFSRTTIASSIKIPMASDRPSSDMVLSVNPKAQTAMNEARTETGRANPVITVERHEFRNTNTTRTVRKAPSRRAFSTSQTELSTRSPESCTSSSSTPFGSVRRTRSIRSSTRELTSVVLYPVDFLMSTPTASVPLNRATLRCSSNPSRTVASSPSRMTRPWRSATTIWENSAGVSSRPLSRIARSELPDSSRPTGAAMF